MHVQHSSCGSTAAYERCGAPAAGAATTRKHRDRADDTASTEKAQRSEPRRNPLVAAMMEAVKSLVPAEKSAATATTQATPATQAAAETDVPTSAADGLKEAALAFAHALYGALRSAGESTPGDSCRKAYGCGQGKAKGWGRDYDDLPQRLEALAQQIAGTPATAANPPPAAQPAAQSATAAVSTTATATATPAAQSVAAAGTGTADALGNAADTAPAADAAATAAITAAGIQLAPPQTQAAAAPENPLVTAFRQLFEALNPKAKADKKDSDEKTDAPAGTPTGAAASDKVPGPAEQLAAFLRQLAQSLRSARGEGMAAAPATGSVIDVAA